MDYNSTRPVERTIFEFRVEGVVSEGVYGLSANNQKPQGTFFWDGRNVFGDQLPTGSYDYTILATSLNADTAVAITDVFGGTATQTFGATYPGLTPLESNLIEGRVTLVNSVDSPYGAGWSCDQEERLRFDPDGCIVLVRGNSEGHLFRSEPGNPDAFLSPPGEFSTLIRNGDGSYTRTLANGTIHSYTGAGKIDRIVDQYGYRTLYFYDQDSLVSIVTPTGHSFALEYSGDKLTRVTDSAGRTTLFEVDANGDLVTMTDAEGFRRTFQYDSDHLLTGQAGARGERTEYVYRNGRVVSARSFDTDGVQLLRQRDFDPSALRGEVGAELAAGRGTILNPILPVSGRTDSMSDGRGVMSFHESDNDGNTVRVEDGLGRATVYEYDADGLPVSRMLANNAVTLFEYDASGNRVLDHEVSNGARITREYAGAANELSRVVDPRNHETRFTYDPLGRRVQKNVNGVVTRYVYDADNILHEVDQSNHAVRSFTHPLDIDEPLAFVGAPGTLFYHGDRLGSVLSLSDDAGEIVQEYVYDAYGNVVAELDPSIVQPFAFTARERDAESGLYYYRARYYDSATGRFISEDPIGLAGGMNLYAYVANNPVNFTDPSGLQTGTSSTSPGLPLPRLPFPTGPLPPPVPPFLQPPPPKAPPPCGGLLCTLKSVKKACDDNPFICDLIKGAGKSAFNAARKKPIKPPKPDDTLPGICKQEGPPTPMCPPQN